MKHTKEQVEKRVRLNALGKKARKVENTGKKKRGKIDLM